MGQKNDSPERPECTDPKISAYMVDYCFGDLPEDKQRIFEAHILDCDACWEEVQRLDQAVQVLRSMRHQGKRNGSQ